MEKIKKNLVLVIALAVEVVFLTVTGISAIVREKTDVTYTAQQIDFSYETMEYVIPNEDGSMSVSFDNWIPEADVWSVRDVRLPRGQYEITVAYEAQGILEKDNWIQVTSSMARNYFSDRLYQIRNGEKQTKIRLMLSSEATDVDVIVHYGGLGLLSVKSIRIEEDMTARLGRFLQFLGLFLTLDILWVVFFSKDLIFVTAEKKACLCMLLGITAFSSLPMLMDELLGGHDLYFHIDRIEGIAAALRSGQFPVRMYPNAFNGYGYACSLFYGDILLYFPAILHLMGIPLFRVYQIYMIAVNFVTALITYRCFGRMFRNKRSGMLCSFLYTCAAYRITNIYVRAAVGELSAMIFFPVLVYALWILVSRESSEREKRKSWIYLALGVTGLVWTHVLSMEMALIFMAAFCLVFAGRLCRPSKLLAIGKAAGAAIVLNLWFLVPFLQYVGGDYNVNNLGNRSIGKSALYLPQIFNVFMTSGGKDAETGMRGEMPLLIGLALTLGMLGFLYLRIVWEKGQEKEWRIGGTALAFGCAAIFITTIYFPWDEIAASESKAAELLRAIQYPWRYLSVATVLLPLVAAAFVRLVKQKKGLRVGRACAAVLILCNVLTVGAFYTGCMNEKKEETYVCQSPADMDMDTLYLFRGTEKAEMTSSVLCDEGIAIEDYRFHKGLTAFQCSNMGDGDGTVTLPLHYYPNYGFDGGNGADGGVSIEKGENNRVMLVIPPGFTGSIRLKFVVPVLWRVCEVLSLLGWVGLAFLAIRKRVWGRKPKPEAKE